MPEAFNDIVVPDDQLGYRLVSKQSETNTGTKVFAGRSVSVVKSPNTFRIICVGGSTTLGVNNQLDSYPAILQSYFDYALAGCTKKIEVINAGRMAYHSWHSRIRAGNELDALSPDKYLLMDGLNDVVAAAAIENIDEAIKQREIFTQLVNTKSSKPKSVATSVLQVLDNLAFFRVAKREVNSLLLQSVMEKKMEAFGFRENVEVFIKERLRKGIKVTLVNYGWITRSNASPQAEAARIPYNFSIPLYQFGRTYVSRINNDTARNLAVPLIELQVLIDALSDQTPLIYRVFTDEMHYTPYSDCIVARHIFSELMKDTALVEFLDGCNPPALNEVDAYSAYRLAWGEHFAGFGFPRQADKPVPVLAMKTENIVSDNLNCVDGWCFLAPQNRDEEGVVILQMAVEKSHGLLAYLPRIHSNKGWVTVEVLRDGEWQSVSKLVKYHDDDQWSPVEARYGFSADAIKPGEAVVWIRLLGKAQLYHKDGSFIFYQAR